MHNLIIRWKDQQGKPQSKEYDNWQEANKARKWLLDNGADEVDVAVVMTIKPKPVHEPID